MWHVLLLFLLSVALMPFVQAQSGRGDFTASLGVFSNNGYRGGTFPAPATGAGTVNLAVEYRFSRLFSAGPYASYTYSWYHYDFSQPNYTEEWKGWDIGARGSFHFSPLIMKKDKVDLYVSAFVGYVGMNMVYDKNNIYRDTLNYSEHALNAGVIAGGRFYFNKHVGLYAEAGLAREAFIGGGVSLNFGGKGKGHIP